MVFDLFFFYCVTVKVIYYIIMKHDALEILGTFVFLLNQVLMCTCLARPMFGGILKRCRIPSRFTLFIDHVVTPCESHVASRSPLADIMSDISMYQQFERSASQ